MARYRRQEKHHPIRPFVTDIEWPNGLGFTPCTQEYADLQERINSIRNKYANPMHTDSFTSEDYETVNRLENDLLCLQADGHVGMGERY